jgi:hypothetical protein
MDLTVQKAEISSDGLTFITIFDNPTPDPVSLTSSTNPIFGQKNDQVPVGTYRVLRLTVTGIIWHASWSPSNPSPCDDGVTSGEAIGPMDLGGHTEFYFKTPDLGGNTLAYYLAHPLLSGYVGDANHPFILTSPIQVIKDLPTTVNLVIGVTDTLTCDSVDTFHRTSGGANATLAGAATKLMGAEGIYFDSYNHEIGVTNSGNNSVTVYDRSAMNDNAVNDIRFSRTLIGPDTRLNGPAGTALYTDPLDSTQSEIVVANTGNDSVTTYSRTASDNAKPLRTLTGSVTGLSSPTGIALYIDQAIPRDPTKDEIVVANSGNNSVTIYDRTASENSPPFHTIQGTGLSDPCGVYVDTDEIGVANRGNGTVTIYNRTDDGNVTPKQTISGLSAPCGLYVDTQNDEIGVADSGNGTVTIYKRLNGAYLLDRTITGLNDPRALYLDTTRDEIGVVHKGGLVVMAQPPSIFPVSANEDASVSALASGNSYYVTLYGVDIKGVDGDGNTIPFVFAERGIATFDGSATPWPRFNLTLDQQIGRRVSTTDCLIGRDVGVTYPGFFGVNHDGSFYAFLPGIHGSLQGAFLPDGTTFVGSMVDDTKKMMLVYGVKIIEPSGTGSSTAYLTSDGSFSGSGAHYAFTAYSNSPLNYLLWIGMAATDSSSINSMSGDANVLISDGRLLYFQDYGYLRVRSPQIYVPDPGGILNKLPPVSLSGAVMADGSTIIFSRDTITNDNGCPTDIDFGMGLRQRPAGTFTTGSIKGTYFAAAFGDRYDIINQTSPHRSTAARLNFNGAGSVEITTIENAEGMISVDKSSFTYQVHPKVIPTKGDTRMKVDVVDIFDRTSVGPYATALIGRGGKILSLYLNPYPGATDHQAPNRTRLLGLAVFQHP